MKRQSYYGAQILEIIIITVLALSTMFYAMKVGLKCQQTLTGY